MNRRTNMIKLALYAEGNQKFRPSSFDPLVGLSMAIPLDGPVDMLGLIRGVEMSANRKTVTITVETETPIKIVALDDGFQGDL